jgi:hypothetical protein
MRTKHRNAGKQRGGNFLLNAPSKIRKALISKNADRILNGGDKTIAMARKLQRLLKVGSQFGAGRPRKRKQRRKGGQKGGFLPLLAMALGPLLGAATGKLIDAI